jgi:hypothetical protein
MKLTGLAAGHRPPAFLQCHRLPVIDSRLPNIFLRGAPMRRLSSVCLCTGLMLTPLPLRAADEFKLEPGFTLLFNGKNLDGWKEASGKKESLEGKTEAYNGRFKVVEGKLVYDPSVKGDLYIETAKEFGKDVHIKFDFKPGPKCNNDLFLRGTKFDIIPGNKENKNVKEGEWYTFEIVVKGDTVEHKINGETVRTSKAGDKATPFKLRAEFGAIEIKNIRVKE